MTLVRLKFFTVLVFVAFASGLATFYLFLDEAPRRNVALFKPAAMSSAHTGIAEIGVDSHEDEFFSTGLEDAPSWTVDLEAENLVNGFEILNRSDCCQERALSLTILVSKDGNNWKTVYRHNKKPFGGQSSDVSALRVDIKPELARFVRVQLAERNYLHLNEIKVWAD